MRATVIIAALLVLFAACASMRVWRPDYKTLPYKKFNPIFRRQVLPALAEDEDDEESDFWMALAPLAINLIKNKLSKKRDAVDEDDEEADFINWRKIGEVAKNVGKSYLSSKYGINLDEEEESDFINWKKIGSIAKDIGKTYLSSKYGINLDQEDEEESDFLGKINWRKIGDIAKNVGKSYLSSKYGINLDEEDDEESDSADAYSQVSAAGIPISSSGRCHNRNVKSCTSLDGVRSNTLNGIITLKRASGCPITITGGTEIGHAGGQYSHSNGYKLDIALNSCIDNYIRGNFKDIGRRGDGAQQYRASSGNVYAREGNHWDITYY